MEKIIIEDKLQNLPQSEPILKRNLYDLAASINDQHRNILVSEANDHCMRLAVNQDATYDWHYHPNSDELFIVLDGELTIEFDSGDREVLESGDFLTVSAGKIHRTIARGKTINLCLERTKAETVFITQSK